MNTDLALQTATELAQRLRRRELSAVELLQHHLGRIEGLNPALNAAVEMAPQPLSSLFTSSAELAAPILRISRAR